MSLTLSHCPSSPRAYDDTTCSPQTTTPADYSALGTLGNVAKRARLAAAMSPEERRAYRKGYLAAAQHVSRLRALLRSASRSLQP